MNTTKQQEFIRLIAAMTMDGENDFIMENDDAVMTLSELIETARELQSEEQKAEKEYTVILLYPDYMTDDYGADIFVSSAFAEDPRRAVELVQEEAAAANSDDIEERDSKDFRCIGVIEGGHNFILDATSF